MTYPSDSLDRRKQPELRAIFPAACEALRPFFDPVNQWAGQNHEHFALRTLKEHFSMLSTEDAYIVLVTVKRLLAQGNYAPVPAKNVTT